MLGDLGSDVVESDAKDKDVTKTDDAKEKAVVKLDGKVKTILIIRSKSVPQGQKKAASEKNTKNKILETENGISQLDAVRVMNKSSEDTLINFENDAQLRTFPRDLEWQIHLQE